jgi:hypothetical protein
MGSPPLDFCTSVSEARLDVQGIVERAPEYAAAGVTWIRVILAGPTMRESIRQNGGVQRSPCSGIGRNEDRLAFTGLA